MKVNYACPSCKEELELEVEIDSPSDYYLLDENCEKCGTKFPESVHDKVFEEIPDYYAGLADYAACYREDR